MVALSFKLSEPIVESLRSFSRMKGISQTKIIEESLVSWLEQEQKKELERQFQVYNQKLQNDPELASEEVFLTNSTTGDSLSLLQKEHA